MDIPALAIGGVSAIALVVVTVEGLKRLGFATEETWLTPQRAALLTGVALGGLSLVGIEGNSAVDYINAAVPNLFGGLNAGLAYDLVGERFFAWLDGVVSATFNV